MWLIVELGKIGTNTGVITSYIRKDFKTYESDKDWYENKTSYILYDDSYFSDWSHEYTNQL